MNQFFLLDDDEENENGIDIGIFFPGPPGPPRVDAGTVLVPVITAGVIAAPVNRWQRSFITAAAPLVQPVIPNPSDNGPWILELFVTPGSSPITLDDAANIKLSGRWIGTDYSILTLEWDGNSKYVEGSRNEI